MFWCELFSAGIVDITGNLTETRLHTFVFNIELKSKISTYNFMKKLFLFFIFFLTYISTQAQKQKVILDCDLGDDVDDAYAVALMLASTDKFDILGITTEYGRTNDRAEMACKMLYEAGLEKIPVAMGRNTSAQDERANWYADQFYWSKGFNKVKPIQQSGADFIIEQLRKYPNEVILFSVGPVTNMKDIIEKDPQVLKLAKKIIAMFGSFYIGYNGSPTINAEWNVVADVEAARHRPGTGEAAVIFVVAALAGA